MEFIIEYLGKEGVLTTRAYPWRISRPHPGDVVYFGKDSKDNPLYGRIEHDNWLNDPDLFHVCESMGSAFLGLTHNEKGRRVYLQISGGPFLSIKRSELKPSKTRRFLVTTLWNWGDNFAGADQAVEYHIARPIFDYVPNEEEE